MAQILHLKGFPEELRLVQALFPELDQGDASLEGVFDLFIQGLPPHPASVGDGVEQQLFSDGFHRDLLNWAK